jgi:hypothetical protein
MAGHPAEAVRTATALFVSDAGAAHGLGFSLKTLSDKRVRGCLSPPVAHPGVHRAAARRLAAVLLGFLASAPAHPAQAEAQLRVAIEPTNTVVLGSGPDFRVRVITVDAQGKAVAAPKGVELATFSDGIFDVDPNNGLLRPHKEGSGWVAVASGSQRAMVQVDVRPSRTPDADLRSAERSLRTAWPALRPSRASFLSVEQLLGGLSEATDPRVAFLKRVADPRPGRVALGGYARADGGLPTGFPVALKLTGELAGTPDPIVQAQFGLDFQGGALHPAVDAAAIGRLTAAALEQVVPSGLKAVADAAGTRRLRTDVLESLRAAGALLVAGAPLPELGDREWVSRLRNEWPTLPAAWNTSRLPPEARTGPDSGFLNYPVTLTLRVGQAELELVLIIAPPAPAGGSGWQVFYMDRQETPAADFDAARAALAGRPGVRLPTREEWIAAARHLAAMAAQAGADAAWRQEYRRFVFGRKEWCDAGGRSAAMGGVTLEIRGEARELPPLPDDSAAALEEWLGNPLVDQRRTEGGELTCVRAVLPVPGPSPPGAAQ